MKVAGDFTYCTVRSVSATLRRAYHSAAILCRPTRLIAAASVVAHETLHDNAHAHDILFITFSFNDR